MYNLLKTTLKKFAQITGVPLYFIRDSYFECKMSLVRLYGISPLQKRRLNAIQNKEEIKIIFGCGETRYDDWVHIDCYFGNNIDLIMDLRRPLPFHSSSVDYCFSEHFLEHLYPDECVRHLAEVYRILKQGGVYRIVVPAGIRFVKKYLDGEDSYFQTAFPWEARPFDAVYCALHWENRHRSFFDLAEIGYLGGKTGFTKIRESAANVSSFKPFTIDNTGPQRIAESLYVELIKE